MSYHLQCWAIAKLGSLKHRVKAVVFPVVMYGWEIWTIKTVERRRIDGFELWCWKRCLRVPQTARSNQSILKEISPGCSLEGLMLKLELQYFGHLMQRANSLEMTLELGKIEGKRTGGQHRMRWLDVISDSMDMSLSTLQEIAKDRRPGMLQFTGSQRVGHDLETGQQPAPMVSLDCELCKWILWVQVLCLVFIFRVTFSRLPNFSVPFFPYLLNENNNSACLIGLFWGYMS